MTSSIVRRARKTILDLNAYQSARSLYKASDDAIFLDANESPYKPFIGGENYNRYPDQQPSKLSQKLAQLYDVSTRNLMISRGTDEAIDVLIRTFCQPFQDNIIQCPPTFVMYRQAALLHETEVLNVNLQNDSFAVDCEGIKSAANENTKIIFLCSPNNPTGSEIPLKNILELCNHFQDHALVVVDEAYIEFSDSLSVTPYIEKHPNLVVLRTLSKGYSAAALRCGCAIGSQDVITLLKKVLAPYPLPSPVCDAVLEVLKDKNLAKQEQKRQEICATKKWFEEQLQSVKGVEKIYSSQTNFLLVKVSDADDFSSQCAAQNIIVRNQSSQPGLDNCIRISIGTRSEMENLLAVLGGATLETTIAQQRIAEKTRITKETKIHVKINLDQTSPIKIETGVGFYDHMLEQIAKHGGFSLQLECGGDLEIDNHHTIEDCAIALGQALKEALGDKEGIGRYGFSLPMDETLARVELDLGGRFALEFDVNFPEAMIGEFPASMTKHVFHSLAENLGANLHITATGENSHHIVEGCFKAFGRALRQAIRPDGTESLPSTKGII